MTVGRRPSSFAFSAYRQEMTMNLQALAEEFQDHALDEQGVPSYSHANPLMAWLFWQRLRHAIRYLEGQNLKRVLDFGCGAGVLFPYLLPRCEQLFAFDINDQAGRATIKRLGLKGVQLLDPSANLGELQPGSIDMVIALDVLEHVADLREVCRTLANLLSPEGQILFSGPTESVVYRLGRRLAGFKTHFHERNIYEVEAGLRTVLEVKVIARLYVPIQLFRICVARKPACCK